MFSWWVHFEHALRKPPLPINADKLVLDDATGQQDWRAAALVQQPVGSDLG